jgi:hypothetical protein
LGGTFESCGYEAERWNLINDIGRDKGCLPAFRFSLGTAVKHSYSSCPNFKVRAPESLLLPLGSPIDRPRAPSPPKGDLEVVYSCDPTSDDNPIKQSDYIYNDPITAKTSPPPYFSPGGSDTHSPPARYYFDDDDVDFEFRELEIYSGSREGYYTYTGISSDQIRLILLSQGKESDPVHCSVKVMDIQKIVDRRLKFEALSYAWGKGNFRENIYLQDFSVPNDGKSVDDVRLLMAQQTKPRPFAVRSNLYQALKQIRSGTKDVWLWVDAICINQKDSVEKSHQIPKMPDIYGHAWTVTIWIGGSDDSDEAEAAMDFVPSIIDLKLLDRLTAQEGSNVKTLQSWVAFAKLLRRPWFSRRWVVQEVAFARRASIRCGTKIISWTDFSDAIELFTRKLEAIRSLYDASELSKYDPDALSHVEITGSKAIVGASNAVIRKVTSHTRSLEGKHHLAVDRLMDLESLVMKFRYLDATDPRDAIYAFLFLANDSGRHFFVSGDTKSSEMGPPIPQYDKPSVEVYAEFIEYVVNATSSLDIICRHWALPYKNPFGSWGWGVKAYGESPSWIGRLKGSAFGDPTGSSGRINGDSLVGDPNHKIYNASGKRHPSVSFGEERGSEDIPILVTSEHQPGLGLKRELPWLTIAADGENEETFIHGNKRVKIEKANQQRDHPTATAGDDTRFQDLAGGQKPRIYTGIMTAEGIILKHISKVSSRVVDGTISDDCFSILGWQHGGEEKDIKDIVWRTLVADRGSDGKNAPAWYKRACVYALRKTSAEGDLNTSKLIANKSMPESVTEYLKRVQSVVWSRKFFECSVFPGSTIFDSFGGSRKPALCKMQKLIGLGSKNIIEDDLVCTLFGCSVPVILRQTGPLEADNSLPVRFIGECFVYGKMDGEVFSDSRTSVKIEEETVRFKIS